MNSHVFDIDKNKFHSRDVLITAKMKRKLHRVYLLENHLLFFPYILEQCDLHQV